MVGRCGMGELTVMEEVREVAKVKGEPTMTRSRWSGRENIGNDGGELASLKGELVVLRRELAAVMEREPW